MCRPQLDRAGKSCDGRGTGATKLTSKLDAVLQASQVKVETDKRVAQLTDSLKQVQHQAAALAQDKERLASQLQQHASASGGVQEVGLCS